MTIDLMNYAPVGDKKNSDFFDEFRLKIYERRKTCGLDDLLDEIAAIVVHVDTGDAIPYLEELYTMSPYRFSAAYLSDTHKIYILTSQPEFPRFIVLEPLDEMFEDDLRRMNLVYPLSRQKPNARYVGEIFRTRDKTEARKVLESHNIRFHYPGDTKNSFYANDHFWFTFPSDFTFNRIGYTEDVMEDYDAMQFGQRFFLKDEQMAELEKREAAVRDLGILDLLTGVDHMATRILAGEREDAILEFLTMSN